MSNLKVNYINWGIGCRIANRIYLNKRLKALPELHTAILTHEKAHSDGFIWNDIVMDVNNESLGNLKKDYYTFIIKNPSSWTEFLPFWRYDGKFVFNPLITFVYIFSLILGRFIWIRLV